MKKNMGSIDRIIRITIGLAIIGLAIHYKSWLGLFAIIPIATAIFSRCPAYLPFGIKTCKIE